MLNASILTAAPIPPALYAACLIVGLGYLAACWAALHYRALAIRWRNDAAIWRTKCNISVRLLRTTWPPRSEPPIDAATAGRVLAVLSGADIKEG